MSSSTDIIAGSLPVTGSVQERKAHASKCAGVLKLIGVISEEITAYATPDGTVKLRGLNSEFITIDDAIFYDDYPGGLLELDGKTVFIDYSIDPGRSGRIVSGLEPGRVVRGLNPGRVVRNLTGRLTS